MFSKKVVNMIDKYLQKEIDIIFEYEFNGLMLLCGDSLKLLMMDDSVEKLDFVLLVNDKSNIDKFFKKYKLKYDKISEYKYLFNYNNKEVIVSVLNDLCYIASLNIDYLFYDIFRKCFIPFGVKRVISDNRITVLNEDMCDYNKISISKRFVSFYNNKQKVRFVKKKRKLCMNNYIFDKEKNKEIDNIIKDRFGIIFDYKFDGIVLLYGGAVKNIVMGNPIHDLDFVILTQGKCQILDFIRKFKLKYTMNAGGGYKIFYNGYSLDIASYDDLLDTGIYDVDLLFYDLDKRMIISCGAINSIETRVITEVNNERNPLYSNKFRLKKLIKFVKYASGSNKRVRVKQNKIIWETKMLKRRIKVYINKIFYGNFRKCFRFLRNCKKEFKWGILLGLVTTVISVMYPALSGKIIASIMLYDYNMIFKLGIIVVIIKLISLLSSHIFSRLYLIVRKKMILNIRRDVAMCILNFDMSNFNENTSGTFIDKLRSDPNEIVKNFNDIEEILFKGIGNLGALIYIFYLDYRIGLILIIFMFIIFQIRMIGIRKRKVFRSAYFNEQERYTGVLGEMINGVGDIKSLDLKDNYMKRTEESFQSVGESEFLGDYYRSIYNKIGHLLQFFALGLVLMLGLYLVKVGELDASSLIIIFMYNTSVFTFLERLGKLVNLFSDLSLSCGRIFDLLDNNIYTNEFFGNKYKNKCSGKIEFDNVRFKYCGNNRMVLDKCSFVIEPGETAALIGKSGTGKTTVLNLISRLYDTLDGNIKIDGVNINEYNENFIRDNISVISQSPYLFDMSIKDNLKLVKEDITDDEIIKVCRMVCMDEYIDTLPNKYDTIIGEGGTKLSGGQKQRLGIARALVKNTKIILLDEITSALDNENGTIIKKVIKNIQKSHTIIIVTHELSMIKDCARILVLDEGKIVGDGQHKDLIKSNNVYKKLYKIK